MKKKVVLIIFLFFFSFLLLFTFSNIVSAKQNSILHINISGEPESLDPRRSSSFNSGILINMLFEGLMNPATDAHIFCWGVAHSVDISPDYTKYTFHLNDTYWSDGRKLTAEDFEYSWKSSLEPSFPSTDSHLFYPIKNAEAAKKGLVPTSQVGVHVIDALTLVVEMERPTPLFLKMVSSIPYLPIPKHIVTKDPSWSTEAATHIGNGPFRINRWKHNEEIGVLKNEKYHHAEIVRCDGLQISMINDEGTVYHLFEKGDLDFAGGDALPLPLEVINELKRGKKLSKALYRNTKHCAFNVTAYPFHNLNMRKAFAMAVNRQSLADGIMYEKEEISLGMIPSLFSGTQQKAYLSDGNIEEARQYFQKALEELQIEAAALDITLKYDQSQINRQTAQALQEQWRKAFGIEVNLLGSEVRLHTTAMRAHQFQIGLTQWTPYYEDAMSIIERFRSKDLLKNYLQWENQEFSSLLDDYFTEITEDKRCAILSRMEDIFMSEMPIIPLFHTSRPYVVADRMTGLQVTPLGVFFFTEAERIMNN